MEALHALSNFWSIVAFFRGAPVFNFGPHFENTIYRGDFLMTAKYARMTNRMFVEGLNPSIHKIADVMSKLLDAPVIIRDEDALNEAESACNNYILFLI